MALTPTTSSSLLLRLRDPRNQEAWSQFVDIYQPAIYRQLRKCGLQDADAQELMQEIFLTVNRQIATWEMNKDRGSFRGWLHRVTRNLVINWMKHGQRRFVAFGGAEPLEALANLPQADGPESTTFDLEIRRSVFRQAAEIVSLEQNPKTWKAFWGTGVEGKTTSLVARELGMSEGAVRVAKCRVLLRLKEVVRALEAGA